jgi:hypothetical protein
MTPDEAGHPTTATTVEPTKEEVSIKMDYSGSDRKVPATKKRPSRSAKKRVVYFVKSDSELKSDEDGDEASKKRSFKKIANTEPDLLHLIADLGHHREVHCTVRFSNSDSNGPEVFEATVNNDDLKPPARRMVLPPPPMPSLDDAEEEEEEEVIPVNHPNDEETSLMMKAFTNKSSTSNAVVPNPALADELISMIKSKFKDGAVTLSLKDPGTNMRKKTNKAAIITSWVRSGNELVTLDPDDMGPNANLTRSRVLAAGLRKYGDGVDKTRVCLSLAYNGLSFDNGVRIGIHPN